MKGFAIYPSKCRLSGRVDRFESVPQPQPLQKTTQAQVPRTQWLPARRSQRRESWCRMALTLMPLPDGWAHTKARTLPAIYREVRVHRVQLKGVESNVGGNFSRARQGTPRSSAFSTQYCQRLMFIAVEQDILLELRESEDY